MARSEARFPEHLAGLLRRSLLSRRGWPEWLGGILLGLINILFFAWAQKPFTIYSGFLNWGRHLYADLAGITSLGAAVSPLADKTSVGDIGLFLGALLAAVAAGEFRLRTPARLLDYVEGAMGGLLMALGVVLAVGCNWGGFFSAITALSLHGYLMFLGLLAGGFLGALYVEWRARREAEELELEVEEVVEVAEHTKRGASAPLLAAVALALPALLAWRMASVGGGFYAVILFMGMAVGVVIQRSRFCFATAFRDILRGGGEFRRSVRLQIGIALGILVGATGTAVLKYMGYVDPTAYVKPAGWSNVLGGLLFGLGMVIAGGCASGSLWRAAEGHVKLWVALAAAVLSYAPLRHLIRSAAPWIYGEKILLVSSLGWAGGLAFIYATLTLWILFLLYLDYRRGSRHGQAV